MHDLGKFAMPDRILRGTQPKLSAAEYAKVKLHPIHGRQLALQVGVDPALLPAIAGHHERWAGGGYPDGLAGEGIPPLARVVAVADVLDAITGRRSYKPARSFAEAMTAIREASGKKLDPRVVAYAEEIAPRLETMITRWQRVTDPGSRR
jgi:HD-GYP domain-containing protein (c-di-GMP phosphodiesterase class II)